MNILPILLDDGEKPSIGTAARGSQV
ncbi:hypothetical protein BESB_052790 [Besnoitia besnoiti]|uniref:Uncharacterized protein n=1 Tax=Besnoitia besnoiti TaxID=94643 RepID=A0A2A9MAX0_BESBE|nr:hypothetical protein BESB_052790 [Besnoitia besnoiti]PFH35628.1 hypothetical protein BESB_052790 [Besnoitia besnoiti]